MARLAGKIALITGGACGQGAADAIAFAREGASVVLTDRDADAGERTAAAIAGAGGTALFLAHDVTEAAGWASVVEAVRARFGALHVLVNNAGITSRQNLMSTTAESWRRVLDVNLTGPLLGMQACAPLMRSSGGGSIVNISSTAAYMAHYDAAYGASKWGLRGLSKCAAIDLAPWNIRVNSVHPGHVAGTSFSRDALPGHRESVMRSIPLGRAAEPEECAALVMFLASDESRYVTGAEFVIDGGYVAGGAMHMRNQIRAEIAARAGEEP